MNKLVILSFKIVLMIFSLNSISKPFNFTLTPMDKHTPFIIVLYLLLVCSVFGNSFSFYILHTNNTNGKLENCYCPDLPLGSLEKRAVFVVTRMSHARAISSPIPHASPFKAATVGLVSRAMASTPRTRPYFSLICSGVTTSGRRPIQKMLPVPVSTMTTQSSSSSMRSQALSNSRSTTGVRL